MTETATPNTKQQGYVDRLVTAARDAIEDVPFCWVMTQADGGGVSARVVREATNRDEAEVWTRWFVTKLDSRKTAEIRKTGHVTLAYQHRAGNAYITLTGRADLIDDRSVVAAHLRPVDDPDGLLAATLIAVRITIEHIEVHIRGVTAEPWGHGRTLLHRDWHGAWRLLTD